MPRTIVAGNWKMHKTARQTREFLDAFLPLVAGRAGDVEIVVAPPYTSLEAASAIIAGQHRVALGAQNVHWEASGAYTGEISVPMLQEFGVRYAIVGHSERRAYAAELDRTVNLKVKALLAHGLVPIVAVGETLAEREAGHTQERTTAQTRAALNGIDAGELARVVLAYEPIWAIGTGQNCDPVEADRAMAAIRQCVEGLGEVPILYGGSMKPENVKAYMEQPNINGGLVGGASLDPLGFAALIERAAARA
jgi:triosephosphate isomerase